MAKVPPIRTYDDTWNLPMKPYSVVTKDGRSVVVKTKIPEHHQSSHPLEQHPTFFLNLGFALATADRISPSPSNNAKAIANSKDYDHIVYEKDNFIQQISIPGYTDIKNETTTIIVAVGKGQKRGENFTRSYRTKVKR